MALALLTGVALLYLATLPTNHAEAEDSLHYAAVAARGDLAEAFRVHPNHLLSAPIGIAVVAASRAVGYRGTAELPLQIANLILGIAALGIFNRVLLKLRLSRPARLLALLALAGSYGFWRYATECDVYVLPLVFLLLVWLRLSAVVQGGCRARDPLALGLLSGAAVLAHQQQLLLVLVVAAALALPDGARLGVRVRRAAIAVAAAAGIVILGYAIAGTLGMGLEPGDIATWARGSGTEGSWGRVSLATPLRAILGLGRAVLGAHFLFAIPGVSRLLAQRLPATMFEEETLLAGGFSLGDAAMLLGGAGIVLLGILVVLLRARDGGKPRSDALKRFLRRVAIPSIAAYAALAAWWDPDNVEFWIPVLPGLVFLFACAVDPIARDRTARAASLITGVCLVVTNLFGSMLPQADERRDYWRVTNRWLLEEARKGDVVVTGAGWISQGYVELYTGARVFSTLRDDAALDTDLRGILGGHDAGRVLVSSSVAEPPEALVRWSRIDPSVASDLFDRMRPGLCELRRDEWQTIYEWSGDSLSPRLDGQ